MDEGREDLFLQTGERAVVAGYLEPRAAATDAVDRPVAGPVHEALAFLNERVLGGPVGGDGPNADLERVAGAIATAAWSDMSVAFSLWCHRMVLEYLWHAPPASALRTAVLPDAARTKLLGTTALAAAMAHHVAKTPLPVSWRSADGGLLLDGRVSWASNLFPPDFVMVTAAAHIDDGRVVIVALPGGAPGITVHPYPPLLALRATGSSSVTLRDVRVSEDRVVARDFTEFVTRVRPTFLLLQSSFCWGLAARALAEARAALDGPNEVFRADADALSAQAAALAGLIRSRLGDPAAGPIRRLVEIRLASARLATAAVALEARTAGGRGYVMTSATARRLREAAFLPVQAPTEGQLRWELSRSA